MKKFLDIFLRVNTKEAEKGLEKTGDKLGGIGKASKVAGNGFKFFGHMMKATGLGVIVGLLAQLLSIFTQNQKIMDAVNRIMLKLQPVFQAVADVIGFLVEIVADAIGWFTDFIGSLMGASDASANFADSLVEQRKKVKLLEAELGLLQLQYLREAELLRQIRDNEALSIEERIQANYELGKVLAEQSQHERSIAQESLRLAEMELSINKDNIDLQVALTNAKTKLAEIDERITGQRSEQLVNLNSLERERKAQQKEAADRREEQLSKEAEMLQKLIDLQNEDIKVTKEKFRTINEQFDNAEKHNKAQLEELERKKKAELDNLKLQKKNAQTNIDIKGEELSTFKSTNEELIKSNKEKSDSFEKIAQEELNKVGFMNVEHIKTQEDLAAFQKAEMEEVGRAVEKLAEETGWSVEKLLSDSTTFDPLLAATRRHVDSWVENTTNGINTATENIKELTKVQSEEIIAITDDQITHTEGAINESIKFIENSKSKEAAIIAKYDKQIADTKESLVKTTDDLQKQADDELFLHFETTQDKEIRLVEEKYAKLLGLAQGDFLATVQLKAQQQAELDAIQELKEQTALDKRRAFLDKMMLIAEENDAKQKETDDEKEATSQERNQKIIDNAVGMMNALLSLSKTKSEKEKTQLEKDLKKGLITEKQYNKKLQQIEAEQLRKEQQAALIQIGIDTARGISGAVTAGAGLVFPANLAAISTGILAVLAGVAQAAGVLGQTVDVGSTDMPDDTIEDMAGDVPGVATFGAIGTVPPPIQAYVVESDVSDAQSLQGELDLQATL